MTWALFKILCKKSWSWLKCNWKVPALLLWTLVVYLATKGNTSAMKDVLESSKRAHKDEVEVLNRAHADEILKLKNLQKEYQETIKELESRFKEEERELSNKQIEEVKKVVIESRGNPGVIKEKIEKEFGIKFHD